MSDPFRVGSDLYTVPGALPPAIHSLPFQGNENQTASYVVGEKSGLAVLSGKDCGLPPFDSLPCGLKFPNQIPNKFRLVCYRIIFRDWTCEGIPVQ